MTITEIWVDVVLTSCGHIVFQVRRASDDAALGKPFSMAINEIKESFADISEEIELKCYVKQQVYKLLSVDPNPTKSAIGEAVKAGRGYVKT